MPPTDAPALPRLSPGLYCSQVSSSGSRVLTLPNILSLARFPLAAAFLAWEGTAVRVALIAAASLTDVLDGWLARRGHTTQLGALLDPVADKTFVFVAISTFLLEGALGPRDYLIVLSRDIMTAIGFVVASVMPTLDPRQFAARWPGKLVTALQLLALLVLVLRPAVFPWLVVPIALASLLAIVDYTLALNRQRVRS